MKEAIPLYFVAWLVRWRDGKGRAVGVRYKRAVNMLFSDRYQWRGVTAFGWHFAFVGWPKTESQKERTARLHRASVGGYQFGERRR